MKKIFFLAFFSYFLSTSMAQEVIPLPLAHAHNDYYHPLPLLDALAQGFTSVEADILNIKGKLYVGHDLPEEKKPNLPMLLETYLEPLFQRYTANDCQIYQGYTAPFYLWIDIKNRPLNSYRKLNRMLKPYKEMLCHYEKGVYVPGKVMIIISGERPIKRIIRDQNRLVVLDGRPEDMPLAYRSDLMPFISQNMWKICRADKNGLLSKKELEKLKTFVARVHAQNRKARLWATLENE